MDTSCAEGGREPPLKKRVIEICDNSQTSVHSVQCVDPLNAPKNAPIFQNPKQMIDNQISKLRAATVRTPLNPVDAFIKRLHSSVQIAEIARLYGLDAVKLEAQAQCEGNSSESRAAQADLTVLQGIATYLTKHRTTSIRWTGAEFLVTVSRIPCRILTIEQQRFEELHRSNHRCSHLYTNFKQGTIYRCPLPECGGATINQRGIKRSLAAHHKAFHKDLQHIQFSFKIEMARSWDYLSLPERLGTGGSSQEAISTQGRPEEDDAQQNERDPNSPASGKVVDEGGVAPQRLVVQEVSTLRQALLGQAASSGGFAQFQGRREKSIKPPDQIGVFCVQDVGSIGRRVQDLGSVFHRGPDLQTVEKEDMERQESAETV